jgi:hydroxymethylbilane synthase
VPIGVGSHFEGDTLVLTGMVASLDGQHLIHDSVSGPRLDPEALGISLAERLRSQGAGEILAQIFADARPQG